MEADPAHPATAGRPSSYTVAQGERICDAVLEGDTLSAVCAQPGMPSRGTVLRWMAAHPDFRLMYRQARLMAAELLADEIMAIADDSLGDFKLNAEGRPVFDGEHVQRSRLRVDARKWMLAKLLPRAYGARVEAPLLPGLPGPGATYGPEGEPIAVVRTLSPEQRRAVSMALAARYTIEQETAGV